MEVSVEEWKLAFVGVDNKIALNRFFIYKHTKAQIKQNKSRLLIYDEHLKRFVSADELLIPNETCKGNKIGGPIAKRKSKDLLYDLLLTKFVNTKLDIYSPGGIGDHPFCKINSRQQNYETISTSNKDFFWGKKYSAKKHRVPALPPVDRKPPLKEEESANTGWAGQRTVDPETDPRPELRTSGDCPIGPSGKRPDKKKPHKKKNVGKRLIVCAKENHKIAAKELYSITRLLQPKSKISDPSTITAPKDQVRNSKVSLVKSQECINKEDNVIKSRVHIEKHHNDFSEGLTNPCLRKTGGTIKSDPSSPSKPKDQAQNSKVTEAKNEDCINKENNAIKSRVLISDKCHSDLSVAHKNPCLSKTASIKISDPSNSKPKEQVQQSNFSEAKNQDCINKRGNVIKSTVLISEKNHRDLSVGQTNPCLHKTGESVTASKLHYNDITKEKAIEHVKCNNSYKSTIVQTQNRSTEGKCINNRQETPDIGLNCEKIGKTKDQSRKTSDRVMPSKAQQETCKPETDLTCSYKDVVSENNNICESIKIEHQNSKINQPLSGQNLQKQSLSKDLPNKITKCDSNNNNNKNVNKSLTICKNISPEIGLKCTKTGQIKDQPGETNESSNICANSKEDSYSNASKCNNISKTIATEHQNIKINQPLLSQNSQKQILLKDLPTNNVKKCDSSYNKDVTKNITFCKGIATGSELCNNSKINKPLSSPNANQYPLSKNIPNIITTTCGSNTKKNSNNNEQNSICSCVESKCDQHRKINQLVLDKKECKPFGKEVPRQVLRCKSDSNVNFNFSNNTNEEKFEQCFRSSELTNKVNCSETNNCIEQTCAQGNKVDHSPLSYSTQCQSNKAKTEALRQPDFSNNGTCSCKETETISKSASKKGLELGLKRPQEPITVCSVGNDNLNDTSKSTLIDSKNLAKKLSPKPCLSIDNTKHCGIDSKVSEKLEAITQDKCLNEISNNNDLSKIKGECYMGFKIKKPLTELSDMNECKTNGLKCKPKELQSEKSKRSSSGGKIKKNKNNKSKGGKKLKKGCGKDLKAGIKEECLGKENIKEMLCKQDHNYDTRIQNIKPNMCQKKHVVKRNKHKLQTINTLSSNMSSRHAKEILKKCKQVINLKSNTKDKKNSSTSLPNVEIQGRKGLSENERLENKSEFKLKKQDQLLKTNRISSCKNKRDKKNIHDNVAEKQPSQTSRLKQTQSTLTAKICSTRSPSRITSEVLLKPVPKKVNNQNSRVRLKGLSNNTVSMTKSSRKCNICSGKKISIQSSPQNKQITQAIVSDNCKATKPPLTTNTLNSKATSLASQKLSALNLHNHEFKTLSAKAKPKTLSKFNTSKSEIGSYTNYTSSPQAIKENKVLVNVSNQTSYNKGCKCSNEGKLQKTPFLASLAASKNGVPLNKSMKKSLCETIKIKEPKIVPIKAYTDGHDFPDNSCENLLLNSNLNTLPFFTKGISGSPTLKREEAGSKSAIVVKPLLPNRISKKNKSLTVLDSGNNVATTLEKIVCKENPSLAKNCKVSSIKAETQTLRNLGRNNKGGIDNNNRPISNEGKDMIRNKNKDVGIYNNNKQSKIMFLNRLAEDKTGPEKVQIRPQEKHHTSVRDLVNIKNIETDRQLVNLASKNPLITNKTIKNDILPFVPKVNSDKIPQATIIPPKSNTTKTTPKTSQKVNGLLKYNIPLKAAKHRIDDQVKKEISQDSRNKITSDPHCTKKLMKSTAVRNLLTGNKISQPSVLRSNTFTVLSSMYDAKKC